MVEVKMKGYEKLGLLLPDQLWTALEIAYVLRGKSEADAKKLIHKLRDEASEVMDEALKKNLDQAKKTIATL